MLEGGNVEEGDTSIVATLSGLLGALDAKLPEFERAVQVSVYRARHARVQLHTGSVHVFIFDASCRNNLHYVCIMNQDCTLSMYSMHSRKVGGSSRVGSLG